MEILNQPLHQNNMTNNIVREIYKFDNNLGASIRRENGEWELAVIRWSGLEFKIVYTYTDGFQDVRKTTSRKEIRQWLREIKNLP
jgi:CRISPR/Cas system CSM-associated protein Csm2 small subunit